MIKNKNVFCLVVFLILTFYSTHLSYAVTYFSDSFSGNLSNWEFVPGSTSDVNSWIVSNGNLVGSVGMGGNSYIYPKTIPTLLSDFVLEFDLMNVSGVDTNVVFRESSDRQNHYILGFRSNDPRWSQDNNNIVLYKYENGYSLIASYPSVSIPRSFNLTQNVWHKVKVVVSGRSIKVYYDGSLAINKNDSGTLFGAGKIALQNWGGNFPGQVINNFDNFRISDGNVQNKVIFLPGMGGSWNERAMVLNQVVAQSEWKMTPFVKNYDSLLKGFDDNGLVKNQDYFVYNYDWRKPMADQVIDFNNYVSSLGIPSNEKINVVGHSLGGIIGRAWTQENPTKVDKLVTLASPHAGSINTYEMWNGAKISDPTNISSIALNVLLSLQEKNDQISVETVRRYMPIIKDILPTFNYLRKNGVVVTPPSSSYLSDKNATVSSVFSQLLAVSGSGIKSTEWINLGERNVFDVLLGRWEQGRPVSYSTSMDGDGPVLKKSAVFEGDGSTNVIAEHGNVPDKSVNLVLAELGLGKTIAVVANNNFSGAVFYMGSPATMKVDCGSGEMGDVDGFVLVANKKIGDCLVKLTGVDNGTYHLVMGNSDDDESWKYAEGNIAIGESKEISVNTADFWYEQVLRETNSLLNNYPTNTNLMNMVTAINLKDRNDLLNYYFLFRKQKMETMTTWRVVNYLERIINLEVPSPDATVIAGARNLALSTKSLTDKTTSLMRRNKVLPTLWQSLNYSQGEELLTNPNYGKYVLAEKIFKLTY